MASGVGILGGTFDPPHLGHLVLAEFAHRRLGLEKVALIPAGSPWQKPAAPVASAEHRLDMVRAAAGLDDKGFLEVDDREVRRPGPTYTIDTLLERGDPNPCLIMGADVALGLPAWHRAEEVMELARIAVSPRSGVDGEEVDAVLGGRAEWLDLPHLPLSGSEIRAQALRGESIEFLVPVPVWHYIAMNCLYGYTEDELEWVVRDPSDWSDPPDPPVSGEANYYPARR